MVEVGGNGVRGKPEGTSGGQLASVFTEITGCIIRTDSNDVKRRAGADVWERWGGEVDGQVGDGHAVSQTAKNHQSWSHLRGGTEAQMAQA